PTLCSGHSRPTTSPSGIVLWSQEPAKGLDFAELFAAGSCFSGSLFASNKLALLHGIHDPALICVNIRFAMPTIAYLANQFPSFFERYVVNEILALRKYGVEVILCSAWRSSFGVAPVHKL